MSQARAFVAESDQIAARVVYYYYVGNLTQQEIADKLGLTRLRVNRIIGQARADGSVRVDLAMPLADCVALAERLVERFKLTAARVVPALDDEMAQRRAIGEEVGPLLDEHLQHGGSLGVGWGRTLRASLNRLPRRQNTNHWVVALMGGLTRGSGMNTFEVSTQFADALDADCWYLAAPLYCSSPEFRDELLNHPELANVMKRAREVNVALMTCGDLSQASLIASTSMVQEYGDSLKQTGAAGDLLGSFLDENGRLVDHPLNRCVLALSPDELRTVPISILASGALRKLPIIRAVLRGGYVNHVVTDEACARALLDDA